MAAQKMEKKGKKNEAEKKRENGRAESFLKIYCDVDSLLQTLTLAYIRLRAREIAKTNQNKNYYKGRKEKNKKRSRLDKKQKQTIFAMHSDFRYDSECNTPSR